MPDSHSSADNRAFFGPEDPDISYSRVWFYLLKSQRKFFPRFAQALKKVGINDPVWYEIIWELEKAGEHGKLMGELQEQLLLPQYALSRHVSRLEETGLVRREYIADGRRKQVLFLTEAGIGKHDEIWPIYLDALVKELSPLMSQDEAYDLARRMIKFLP
ncbi:MarR family winged helix-turn-helix transcriptional regulator [Shimia thalassica]|uniref:MarR family winged helix-turn-helix transcriptional regulator n=1 Tax=Shimia thalassica TaxID=1715693 RepID=UPI002732ADE4|nr:MarR family winged helix-turn-helix transcriptional regulator [Shimia thalassica]MDP2579963.1 MarR family winged helix-turn-helix transcriptional regulator [Shimia thalassica]